MGLSSQLAPSAIAKPGVCTSSTRPASPYEGQVIYETDTDKTLVWNGSAWVYLSTSTANPVGLELVKTQTIGTAVATQAVTNAFSADFDAYRIIVTGGSASTSNNLTLRMGSTTTGYYSSLVGAQYSGGTIASGGRNNTEPHFDWAGYAMSATLQLDVTLLNPYAAENTFMTGSLIAYNAGYFATGKLDNTTSYTDFTLGIASGTMTGGTITIYGFRKA